MQTRCISCGRTIEGVAQFCPDCQARQDAALGPSARKEPISPPQAGGPPRLAGRETLPNSHTADYMFLAVIGGGIVAVAIWLLALGGLDALGLGGDDSPDAVKTSPTPGPAATSAPLGYVAGDCEFEAPATVVVECGRLTVPQDRAQPDAGTASLPVAVFRSQSADRRPDPIVYLDGGPGGNTLENAAGLYEAFRPLLSDRDLILFDQRGAGASEPAIDCPEITDLNYDLLERSYSVDERVAQDTAATSECYGRLRSEGINPSYATSAENAADVNDLRAALGYVQWNLFGISYGTRLALTVMRDHAAGVRSAVLDSTYPPQSDLFTEYPANFNRSLEQMFASCAGDPSCGPAFPDLPQVFAETVAGLNETPASIAIGSLTGRPIEGAVIDGIWFTAFVFQSLYSHQLISILPMMIYDTRDGDYELLTILADFYLQNAESVSPGMYLSVQCGEELPFTNREAALAAAAANPVLQPSSELQAKSIFASCDTWEAPSADALENAPVASDIPSLVLAGEFDPITPPAWGRLAAGSLASGFYFEFPALAHGVSLSHECPRAITAGFLEDPRSAPASGCIAGMSGLEWAVN